MNTYRITITRHGIPCLHEFYAHTPAQATGMAVALFPGCTYGHPRELCTGSYRRTQDSEPVFREIVCSGFGQLGAA